MTDEEKETETEDELYKEAAKEVFEGKEEDQPADLEESDNTDSEELPDETASASTETEEGNPDADPWAGVNPALRQTLESLNSTVAPLAERLKQAERRIGSMQNDYSAWKKNVEAKVEAPSQEEIAEASKDKEDWDALEEEYPDWTEAVQKKFEQLQEKHEQETQNALQQIQELTNQVQAGNQQRGQYDESLEKRLLGLRYPGYQTIIASDDYQQWLVKQPQDMIQKTYSPVAEDAIAVLDAYTAAKSSKRVNKKNNKQRRLQEAILPEGHEAIPPKSEEDMTEAEYRRKYASELWGH